MKLSIQWLCRSEPDLISFIDYINAQWDRSNGVLIEVSEIGQKRSDSASSLLHIWCRTLVKEMPHKEIDGNITPNTADDIKKFAKSMWGATYKKANPFDGKVRSVLKSTKEYDSGEMVHLMSSLQVWAAERGIMLVSSGEFARLNQENG